MSLPLSRPLIRRKELDQVLDSLIHDQLRSAVKTEQLVHEFVRFCEGSKGWAFASPFAAIHFLLKGIQLSPGDSVILSPLAPAYFSDAIVSLGGVPLFSDVLADCPVLDPEAVRSKLGENPRAIILDTCLGYLPDYEAFKTMGVFLIEDVSQGLGGFRDLQAAGTVGDFVHYRLGPENLITAGNGSLVAVRRKKHLDEFFLGEPSVFEGLPDFSAALALSQWTEREVLVAKKKENFRHLFHRLPKGLQQPKQDGESEVVGPWFPIIASTDAKEIITYSRRKGVEADWAFRAQTHLNVDSDVDFCPRARYFLFHTLVFPLYASISAKEMELLGKVVSTLP